jgi:putative endonuclease
MQLSYVYILKCNDGTYYTGVSSNLSQRISDHQNGKHRNSYTYSRRPVTLMFSAEFTDINLAIESEKQIKKWSKAKKIALINGDFELLPSLAKKKFS